MISFPSLTLMILFAWTKDCYVHGEEEVVDNDSLFLPTTTNTTDSYYDIVFHATNEDIRLCLTDFNRIKEEMFYNNDDININSENDEYMYYDDTSGEVFSQDSMHTTQEHRKLQTCKLPSLCTNYVCTSGFFTRTQICNLGCGSSCGVSCRSRRYVRHSRIRRSLQTANAILPMYTIARAGTNSNTTYHRLATYTNGGRINIAGYAHLPLSLVAHTTGTFNFVKFTYSSPTKPTYINTEWQAPYSVDGNSGNWFNPEPDLNITGVKTILIEGFDNSHTKISSQTLQFEVIKNYTLNLGRRALRGQRHLLDITAFDNHQYNDIDTSSNNIMDSNDVDNELEQQYESDYNNLFHFTKISMDIPLENIMSKYRSYIEHKMKDENSHQCKSILQNMPYTTTAGIP